jgi:hypothetical protein
MPLALVMLELEALNQRAKPEIAVHHIITCSKRIIKNMDDHLFCSRRHRFDSGLADLKTEQTHGTFWQWQNTL